jgi:hypothetical protein
MWIFPKRVISLCAAGWYLAAAPTPPFPFGNAAGDIFTAPNDNGSSRRVTLPQPMAYLGSLGSIVDQNINGFITLMDSKFFLRVFVNAYFINIDTSNCGKDQKLCCWNWDNFQSTSDHCCYLVQGRFVSSTKRATKHFPADHAIQRDRRNMGHLCVYSIGVFPGPIAR